MNEEIESYLKNKGADFVKFVNVSELTADWDIKYPSAVLFGIALSGKYLDDIKNGRKPEHREIFNTETKADKLAEMLAEELRAKGYLADSKFKVGIIPHKTVALRAGIGFIGKNNLLVTENFGCGVMLGKVLTNAPVKTEYHAPEVPRCGDCNLCVEVCATKALSGVTWTITTERDRIITRKLCILCHKCMAICPFTQQYIKKSVYKKIRFS